MSTNIVRGNVAKLLLFKATYNPAAVAADTTANNGTTVPAPGARVGDLVIPFKPTNHTGVIVTAARVSAADTIQVSFGNVTAGSLDPASEEWIFLVIKPDVQTIPGDVLG